MALGIDIPARLDEGSFKQAANWIDRFFVNAGDSASTGFAKGFANGGRELQKATSTYVKAYDAIADAAGRAATAETERDRLRDRSKTLANELAAAEKKYGDALQAEGSQAQSTITALRELERIKDAQASNNTRIVRNTEAGQRARRDEVRQIRESITAYRELEDAQRRAQNPNLSRSFSSYTRGGGGLLSGISSQSSGIVGELSSIGSSGGKAFIGGAVAAILAGNLVSAVSSVARQAVGVMKDIFNTELDFQSVANKLQGVTRATPAQRAQFESAAKALGSDLTLPGVSQTGALQAMLELSKGGLTQPDVLKSVRGTLQLSTAAGITPEEAAASQASVLQSFQLDPSQAGHVADLLTAVQQVAPGEIPDFALALQQAGTVAHGFGISVEDTLATLGVFAKAGIVGSDAGTSFKTMLTHLANPSDPASSAMDELGLNLTDAATGNFVGPRALLEQLNQASMRMRPDDFQRNVAQVFGTDAIRGAMIGGNQGTGTFDQVIGEFRHGGQADEMSRAMMQGLPGIKEQVANTVESIKLSLGELFNTPGGQEFGNKIVAGLSGISNWINTHKAEIVEFTSGLVSAFATGADAFLTYVARMLDAGALLQDGLSHTFGTMMEGFAKVAEGVGGIIKHIPGLGMVIGPKLEGAGKAVDDIVDKWQNAPNQMRGLSDTIDGMREGIRGARDDFTAMMGRVQDAARLTDVLGSAVATLPDGKTITINDNSPEIKAKLEGLGFSVKQLPDGKIEITARTDQADQIAKAWRAQQEGTPVNVSVMPQFDGVQASIGNYFANLRPTITPSIAVPDAPPPVSPPPSIAPPTPGNPFALPRAEGGLFGSMPSSAMIQPATRGLIQWAEPSTGGEAFIPLNGGARSRSIWAQTGRLLGAFDQGGFNGLNGVDAAILSHVPAGSYNASGDLAQGLGDCSSAVEDLVNILDGRPTAGRSMNTGNADQWLTAHGFLPGSMPGAFNVGFNSGHMQATLPGGTPFNWGSDAAAARGGVGGTGAFDPSFTSHYYRPVAMSAGSGYGGGYYGAPDPKKIADAERDVRDAEAKVAIQEQQVRELKADATQSQRMAAEDEARRAREDRDEAYAKLAEARRGTYQSAGSAGASGGSAAAGGQRFDPIGAFLEGLESTGGWAAVIAGGVKNIAGLAAAASGYGQSGAGGGGADFGLGAAAPAPYSPIGSPVGPSAMGPAPLGGGLGAPLGTPASGMGLGPLPGPAPGAPMGMAPTAAPGGGGGGIGPSGGGLMGAGMGMAPAGMPMGGSAPGGGGGGVIGAAASMFPGGGVMAQLAMRSAQFAGQAAGIGVSGLMETFLPHESPLAGNSWAQRLASGIAGVHPAAANQAGPQQAPAMGQAGSGQMGGGMGGNTFNTTVNNNRPTEDGTGRDLTYHLSNMYSGAGR